jgi:abequosyltransferase
LTKLSVCIPTYNRAELLRETLAGFQAQLTPDTQVVISDNASTDHTRDVVAEFQRLHPNTVYHCWPSNMGADRNFLKVIELAHGEYCWFFGSDDMPRPSSVQAVLSLIESRHDIYLFNRMRSTFDLQPWAMESFLDRSVTARSFDFRKSDDLASYLSAAGTVGALFSFLSSIVIRREAWNSITYDERFTGTAYSHAFVLLSLVRSGCSLRYEPSCLVNCRFGNDSFAQNGVARRILLDLEGYGAIRDLVFRGDAMAQAGINAVLRREYPWYRIVRRRLAMNAEEWCRVRSEFEKIGYSRLALGIAGQAVKAGYLVNALLWLKQNLLHRIQKAQTRNLELTAATEPRP